MNISSQLSRIPLRVSVTVSVLIAAIAAGGCSTRGSASIAQPESEVTRTAASQPAGEPSEATIEVQPGGPADTVRAFYRHLRDKRFREAIFLTNLRPAIEGLTDTELKDFAVDFEALAGQVPADLEINGEIISGEHATVTANLPDEDGKKELQQIKLKKRGDIWIIQTVDEAAEARIRKDGKQYFYNLRIETHEDEARRMLERISKAQMAYALQNGGVYAGIDALIAAGLLPEDAKTSSSTGYSYSIALSPDKKTYTAAATPAEYGRSGKLSFSLAPDPKSGWRIASRDTGGKPLINK